MAAQEILEACDDVVATAGVGGSGGGESNLANPALGKSNSYHNKIWKLYRYVEFQVNQPLKVLEG